MNNRIRSIIQVAIAAAALGAGAQALAAQGITGKLSGKARPQGQEQRSEQAQEQRREEPRAAGRSQPQSRPAREEQQPARREQPAARREEPAARREDSTARREQPARQAAPARPAVEREAAPPRESAPRREAAPRTDTPRVVQQQPAPRVEAPVAGTRQAESGRSDASRSNDRGLLGNLIQREYDGRDNRDRDDRDGRDGRDGDRDGRDGRDDRDGRDRDDRDRGDSRGGDRDWDRDRDRDWDRDRRPGRVVTYLPSGYRDYAWNGTRYYYHSGYWYRPYGSSFISISIPFGLFVGTLPGSYTSFSYGSTRYYYSDHHYYLYEPARRGYVVVRSPYGDDDREYLDSRLERDLYIYPAQGQSEQEQADDRYDCHRWAVDETGYDPLDDDYDAVLRDDYRRAITACLTGRGYTVR
jgi:hypothetical protein